ncbi:MAG: SoxR reducing system RseC family protein [Vicinamibacterales bacterium]|nr:SoxR reducing system RseC family protein [Vicinamibacterales bacterium]
MMPAAAESQLEEGVVVAVLPGTPARVQVRLLPGPGCDECGARVFCVPEDAERRHLVARVSHQVPAAGDVVRVAVRGTRVLAAGAWAYGLPLAGLCTGTVGGWFLLAGWPHRELLASALGLVLTALPLGALWLRSRSRPSDEWFDAWVADPGDR